MKLADKPVYATVGDSVSQNYLQEGLTYKQWLVGMLASNPAVVEFNESATYENNLSINTKAVIDQADAIIAELEKENGRS